MGRQTVAGKLSAKNKLIKSNTNIILSLDILINHIGLLSQNIEQTDSKRVSGRHLSSGVRAKTPTSPKFNPNSSNSFKEMQEIKNTSVWNSIANKDYENYVKEQETKKIKRKEQQDNMRSFYDKQLKEQEFKKSVHNKMLVSGKPLLSLISFRL